MKRGSDLSKVYGNSHYALATSDQDSPWKIGDTILVENETLEIAGLLNYVDTVGRNKKQNAEYIRNQLESNRLADQLGLKEFVDPFTGRENKKA